jgi:ribosomal protein S27AE
MGQTLEDAREALRRGDKGLAIGILSAIVTSAADNETAWLMLASLLDEDEKKKYCLERVLAINAENSSAAMELSKLRQPVIVSSSNQMASMQSQTPAVENVQCPKCGAPVMVVSGRESFHCTYCGAGLKIALGASGHPFAVLDDIKSDTNIIAKEVLLRRLNSELVSLEEEYERLSAAFNTEYWAEMPPPILTQAVTVIVWLLGMGLVYLLLTALGMKTYSDDYSQIIWTPLFVSMFLGAVPAFLVNGRIKSESYRARQVRDEYQPTLHQMLAAIEDKKTRVKRIEHEMGIVADQL